MDKQIDLEKGWEEYKAKRNQEIEELAKVLCVNRKPLKCKDCVIRGMCEFKETAKEVYDAGYRKIPENAVVLTRERYEELEKAVDSVQVAVSSFTRLETLYKIKCKEVELAEAKTRKETSEKLGGTLKDEYLPIISGYMDDDEAEECNSSLCEMTDEIVKEFTGGGNGK